MRSFLPALLAVGFGVSTAHATLVIYYPLDELSGNIAVDSAPAGGEQSATATVAASNWQPAGGIIGGGLQFSPTLQADVDEALIYNTANATTSFLSATPFTITVWLKTTDASNWTHAAIFAGNGTLGSSYYAVGTSTTQLPQLVARNTTAINTIGPTATNDGNWHQLTAVFAANTSRTLYVDGQFAGTSATSVTHMVLNRFGLGALTRAAQTDAYSGLLDEAGLFDTAFSPQQAALLNAFPRFDSVRLDDSDYDLALSVFNTQSGSVNTGTWTWSYATGLPGALGSTGTSGGNPYVVLDSSGNGLAAVPEPSAALTAFASLLGLGLGRPRRKACA